MSNKHFESKIIKCSTGEETIGYKRYLLTKHWKELRIKVAEHYNYTCTRCCGTFKTGFTIHHNNYKRLGKEKLTDLTFYCSRCHTILHHNRQEKKTFNKQYSTLISSKMAKFSEEQVLKVIDYIERIS